MGKRFFIGLLGMGILLCACAKEEEIDPELIGTWRNAFMTVTFLENGRFGQRYNSAAVANDSIFGTYSVDAKRKNVTLEGEGFRVAANDSIVYQNLTDQVWNYRISGTSLEIESPTLTTNFTRSN